MEILRRAGASPTEAEHWGRWLQAAEVISAEFDAWEDDPFGYNETASVGILAAAAFRAGLVSLPEYVAEKANKADGRKRVGGRCDLWLAASRSDWAFEFKNMIVGNPPRVATLRARLQKAVVCAKQVTATSAAKRVGCLIVSTFPASSTSDGNLRNRLLEFAPEADFAAAIHPDGEYAKPVYFFMRHFRA
jgi:hypothetical protein